MKILMVGGNGTIGKRVSTHFSKKHEVIIAGRTCGDVIMDMGDSQSVKAMFEKTGKVVNGFVKSIEGKGNGGIIKMYDNC